MVKMLRQFRGLKSCITDLAGGTDLAHMDLFVSANLETIILIDASTCLSCRGVPLWAPPLCHRISSKLKRGVPTEGHPYKQGSLARLQGKNFDVTLLLRAIVSITVQRAGDTRPTPGML
jgi:hypothetical protein